MPDKPAVFVTVIGRPASGVTTLMRLFIETLQAHNIDVQPQWGIDGPPFESPPEIHQKKLASISYRSKVVLSEHVRQRKQNPEDADRLRVQTLFDKDKGYGVRVSMAGHPLESWFGEFENSKERSRAVAARFSTEFDVDVEDMIPREYDWVQPH